jgi:hypothetical protein
MFAINSNRLISELLVKLNDEDIPRSERDYLSNSLSIAVLEVTKNLKVAQKIIEDEKEKIKIREIKKTRYLFDKELVLEDIISFYYEKSFLGEDGNRTLSRDLTLSELSLMLVAFESFRDQYSLDNEKEVEKYAKRQFNGKVTGMAGVVMLYIASTQADKLREYFDNICVSIKKEIYKYREVPSDDLEEENFPGIKAIEPVFDLKGLKKQATNRFKLVKNALKDRRKNGMPNAEDDYELLSRCGDESYELKEALNRSEINGYKEKRI